MDGFSVQLAATLQLLALVCYEHRHTKTVMAAEVDHYCAHPCANILTARGAQHHSSAARGTVPHVNELVDIANLMAHVGGVATPSLVHACLMATYTSAPWELLRKLCDDTTLSILEELSAVQRANYELHALRALSAAARTVLLAHLAYGAERIAARDTALSPQGARDWMRAARGLAQHIGPANRALYVHFLESADVYFGDKRD